jgi:hypothetical protein
MRGNAARWPKTTGPWEAVRILTPLNCGRFWRSSVDALNAISPKSENALPWSPWLAKTASSGGGTICHRQLDNVFPR